MRTFLKIFILLLAPVLVSCSNCKITKGEETNNNQSNPTTTTPNISVVTATISEIQFNSETDYKIKADIMTVEATDRLPSMAVSGSEYTLIPNFRYEDNQLIESDVNESLKKLGRLSSGKKFKAEISYEYQKGWFIQKILSMD